MTTGKARNGLDKRRMSPIRRQTETSVTPGLVASGNISRMADAAATDATLGSLGTFGVMKAEQKTP